MSPMVVRALKVRAESTSAQKYNLIKRKSNSCAVTFDNLIFSAWLIRFLNWIIIYTFHNLMITSVLSNEPTLIKAT